MMLRRVWPEENAVVAVLTLSRRARGGGACSARAAASVSIGRVRLRRRVTIPSTPHIGRQCPDEAAACARQQDRRYSRAMRSRAKSCALCRTSGSPSASERCVDRCGHGRMISGRHETSPLALLQDLRRSADAIGADDGCPARQRLHERVGTALGQRRADENARTAHPRERISARNPGSATSSVTPELGPRLRSWRARDLRRG